MIQRMIEIYEPAVLIVGTRGKSLNGFQGLLPGSISKYCLQHSPVPVIVVRPSSKREKKKLKRQADPSRRTYMDIVENSKAGSTRTLTNTGFQSTSQLPVANPVEQVWPVNNSLSSIETAFASSTTDLTKLGRVSSVPEETQHLNDQLGNLSLESHHNHHHHHFTSAHSSTEDLEAVDAARAALSAARTGAKEPAPDSTAAAPTTPAPPPEIFISGVEDPAPTAEKNDLVIKEPHSDDDTGR